MYHTKIRTVKKPPTLVVNVVNISADSRPRKIQFQLKNDCKICRLFTIDKVNRFKGITEDDSGIDQQFI